MKQENIIDWLQFWFAQQANGDWQHQYGIKIETLDNPGWSVVVDLADTPLSGKPFVELKREVGEHDWITCRVRENRFEAFCSPNQLNDALSIFRRWVVGD